MNWAQLKTIVWLRWRLNRNQWLRGNRLNAVLAVLAAIAGVVMAIGGGIGGVLLGTFGLTKAPATDLMVVWDVVIGFFLFFWMFGVITEIQRSEAIDIGRLLHLPISLKGVFVVNYFVSHLRPMLILSVPAMFGLAVGLGVGRGPIMFLLLPLVAGFLFMITAWTYCLRGWLVTLMVNQRRRRAIIVGLTLALILIAQAPNLYFNVILDHGHRRARRTETIAADRSSSNRRTQRRNALLSPVSLTVHQAVPLLWIANGARTLANGNVWPALWGAFGAFILGGLGLHRAYRGTLRFYQGQGQTAAKKVKPRPKTAVKARGNFLEKQVPGVPEEAGVMALATFRSMSRAPEVRLAFASSFVMLVVISTIVFARNVEAMSGKAAPFVATGLVVFAFMSLLQIMMNQFGFDREGFRALVLLPAPRKLLLLGKNLALLPVVAVMGLVLLAIIKFVFGLSALGILAAAVQFVAAFQITCIVGNFASILVPYRIGTGGLKPTKMPLKATVLIFAVHLLFPLVMIPIFIPPALGLLANLFAWLPGVPVSLTLSVLMVVVLAFAYWLSLGRLGQLLLEREKRILQVVTHEVE